MHILIVLTSHDRLGDSGSKTGSGREEFCAAYYVFRDCRRRSDAGIACRRQPPIDHKATGQTTNPGRCGGSRAIRRHGQNLRTRSSLKQVVPEDFDAVFYVGGHGALWDLPEDRISQALIAAVHAAESRSRWSAMDQLRCDGSWMPAAVLWSRVAA